MCEERKDTNAKLTDEAVEAVTGGDDEMVCHTEEAWCPICNYVQHYEGQTFKKNCPACGTPYF